MCVILKCIVHVALISSTVHSFIENLNYVQITINISAISNGRILTLLLLNMWVHSVL